MNQKLTLLKVHQHYPGKELDGEPILVNPYHIQSIKPSKFENVCYLIFTDVASPKDAKINNRILVKHSINSFVESLKDHKLIEIIEI